MATDVAGDLAAACRVTDHDSVIQVERLEEFRQIVGIRVHIVAIPRLTRPAVAATIVRDAAVAVGRKKEHLRFPGVCAQRPAVTEDDRLTRAPVLVIDLRFVPSSDRAHSLFPFVVPCDAAECSQTWIIL